MFSENQYKMVMNNFSSGFMFDVPPNLVGVIADHAAELGLKISFRMVKGQYRVYCTGVVAAAKKYIQSGATADRVAEVVALAGGKVGAKSLKALCIDAMPDAGPKHVKIAIALAMDEGLIDRISEVQGVGRPKHYYVTK